MNKLTVTRRVVAAIGGQQALASLCGVSQQSVSYWVKRNEIPVNRILHIESLLVGTGADIDRHDMRPDVYGARSELKNTEVLHA